jgi:hypothetical protein
LPFIISTAKYFIMKKSILLIAIAALFASGCSVWQSALKSTFPYKTTIAVPKSSATNTPLSVSSFDQDFNKNGNNADKVKNVHIVSAKIISDDPSDFDLGNFTSVKVYLAKSDGSDEIIVASRTDITPQVGGELVLDIDNTHTLDELIRAPDVKIRMEYVLHNHIYVNAHLKLVLSVRAAP